MVAIGGCAVIVTGFAVAAWLWAPATSAGAESATDAASETAADAATSGVLTPLAGVVAGALVAIAGIALLIDARRSRRSPMSPPHAVNPHHRAMDPVAEPAVDVAIAHRSTGRRAHEDVATDERADGPAPGTIATAADRLFRNRLAAGLQDELFTHRGASISGS